MKKPTELDGYGFPDRIQVPDGYDMKSIPDLTRENFNYLIDEYNNLVEVVNMLIDEHPNLLIRNKLRGEND